MVRALCPAFHTFFSSCVPGQRTLYFPKTFFDQPGRKHEECGSGRLARLAREAMLVGMCRNTLPQANFGARLLRSVGILACVQEDLLDDLELQEGSGRQGYQ